LSEVVPVGWHEQQHLSASYREAIGSIYATLHPNPVTLAEAVVHEFQHNKANLASFSDALLRNAFHPLFKSPVRPDPRPLWGILLAVHAFLPVAELLRRMREAGHPASKTPDFLRRLEDVDGKNREGMEMLRKHAEWTPFGRRLMNGLEAMERRHAEDLAARGKAVDATAAHD
jgi:HEXXH motif-containing protein